MVYKSKNEILLNMKKNIIISLLLTTFIISACGTVLFTGRRQVLLFSDSEITALSEQSYTDFMKTAKPSTNKVNVATVREVGSRMVAALETYLKKNNQESALQGLKWDFQLVESNQVNAFCMPSGKIVFYEGILNYADTPDYIAVVMGHEIAHALAKHGNERMSQQAALNLVGGVASDVVGAKKGRVAQSLFNLGFNVGSQVGVILPYSRKHEYEADRIGVYLMDLAGYDINAAPKFWEKMSANSKSENDFFSTHPADSKRITALNKVVAEMTK